MRGVGGERFPRFESPAGLRRFNITLIMYFFNAGKDLRFTSVHLAFFNCYGEMTFQPLWLCHYVENRGPRWGLIVLFSLCSVWAR